MIQIHDCPQCSPEWYAARLGMPTASEFHTILAKGKDGGASVTRRKYLLQLAGEIITGEPAETYSNSHFERGKVMEDEAREFYAFAEAADLTRIGFVVNGPKGCSPDSLIGANGILEIKTALPHILAECLLKDEFPPQHKAQCQGALWVCEREWIDIAIYWPRMPMFVKRAHRDAAYIATIANAVDAFLIELDAAVARLRRLQTPLAAVA